MGWCMVSGNRLLSSRLWRRVVRTGRKLKQPAPESFTSYAYRYAHVSTQYGTTQLLLIYLVNEHLIKCRVWCERREIPSSRLLLDEIDSKVDITDSFPYYNYVVEIFVAQKLCVGSTRAVSLKHPNA